MMIPLTPINSDPNFHKRRSNTNNTSFVSLDKYIVTQSRTILYISKVKSILYKGESDVTPLVTKVHHTLCPVSVGLLIHHFANKSESIPHLTFFEL